MTSAEEIASLACPGVAVRSVISNTGRWADELEPVARGYRYGGLTSDVCLTEIKVVHATSCVGSIIYATPLPNLSSAHTLGGIHRVNDTVSLFLESSATLSQRTR